MPHPPALGSVAQLRGDVGAAARPAASGAGRSDDRRDTEYSSSAPPTDITPRELRRLEKLADALDLQADLLSGLPR